MLVSYKLKYIPEATTYTERGSFGNNVEFFAQNNTAPTIV